MTLFLAPAIEAQSFWPLITHSLPSRTATVRIAPMSEPASGSDIEIDILISPEKSFGSQWRFCSSDALRTRLSPQKTFPV